MKKIIIIYVLNILIFLSKGTLVSSNIYAFLNFDLIYSVILILINR
ncbi:hypothetical protein [Oceanivirga salmonicida]|nr:hypothetical protein [Oceanivirga salmonicida]